MRPVVIIISVLIFISCSTGTKQPPDELNPLKSESLFGVDLSLSPDDNTFPHSDHDLILRRIREMNIRWVRETFMQTGIEYPRGIYNWEEYDEVVRRWQKYDIHVLATIFGSSNFSGPQVDNRDFTGENDEQTTAIRNPGYKLVPRKDSYGNAESTLEDWANFVSAVVERYDGDGKQDMPGLKYPIKYWEGWNEPNYWSEKGGFWHKKWQDSLNTEDLNFLIELQQTYYETVKKADPEAVVVGPSVLTRSSYETDHRAEFYCHQDVRDYFDVVNYHRNHQYSWADWDTSTQCVPEKPIWVTEFNRHTLPGETEHENSVKLIKLFIEAGYQTKYRLMRAYHYFKQSTENMYIDITKSEYPLKETGVFVKVLFDKLDRSTPVNYISTEDYRLFEFQNGDGAIYAVWAIQADRKILIPVKTEQVKITTLSGDEKILNSAGQAIEIEISSEPMYIEEI